MTIELSFVSIAAVVIPFLVNLLKTKVAFIGTRYAPVVAFVLGALAGYIGQLLGLLTGVTAFQAIVIGIGIGGTSTGLYDLTKTTIAGK